MSPDFSREVHCLLGLPFDAVDMDGALGKLRHAIASGERCFLSTPNLNFTIAALSDTEFRDSVVSGDLNVADGMPLIWVARLLGIPLRERVAGSSLFERLRRDAGPSIKVFFFGGPDGVAGKASERLNAEPSPMRCVGFDSPGFGSVEDMSGADRLARINDSGADFVVVSLGAKKGQAWIVHNLQALRAPVVSHLGAVVNFVAGTVRRAPEWMGRSGLEWLWRVWEEHALWRRYAGDGLAFLRLLLTHVLPRWLRLRLNAPDPVQREAASVELREEGATLTLVLRSAWWGNDKAKLRAALASSANDARPLRLDLSAATHLDSATIGLLSLMWAHRRKSGLGWDVIATHPGAMRDLVQSCAGYLLQTNRPTVRQTAEVVAC